MEKDSTEIHVLGVSSDKCSPVKSRGGMKDYLIRTWLFTRSLLEEATRILNLYVKGSRRELEERLKERAYRELKLVPNDFRSGRERRRERRKQERKARWLECQKLESFYFGKLGKSRRSAVLGKKRIIGVDSAKSGK